MAYQHNSKVAESEPDWGEVDKSALPREAHAEMGDPDKKSTWGYPHHWISGGTERNDQGVWTNGTMYLHKGGLNAAWAAAMGARSGEEASLDVVSHLRSHRRALGIEDEGEASSAILDDARRRAEAYRRMRAARRRR